MPQLDGEAKEAYIHVLGQDTYEVRGAFHDNATFRDDKTILPVDNGTCGQEMRLAHVPRHDAESCYWIIVVFAFLAFPANALDADDTTIMSGYLAGFERHCLGSMLDGRAQMFNMNQKTWEAAVHPRLRQLVPFLMKLSKVVEPEYGRSAKPLNLYHLHEAMGVSTGNLFRYT